MKIFAGIGARETPLSILKEMEEIAYTRVSDGWKLRSGNARGADLAFQTGGNRVDPTSVKIYLPKKNYNLHHIVEGNSVVLHSSQEAKDIVLQLHPSPFYVKTNPWMMNFHMRNVFILLGKNLDKPVGEVICWTKGGKVVGGTGMGIRIAEEFGIPVTNLGGGS